MTTLDDIFGLRGHRAIVTGASSGLGVELAEALAIAGCELVLVARREERLREVAAEIGERGVRVAVVPADLSALDRADETLARCEDALGPVDILVNNAGINRAARLERFDLDLWRKVIDIDLNAVFALSRAFAARRLEHGEAGRIINVTSVHGTVAAANPGLSAYAAAKGGLELLTRQMAVEWSPRGILVNAIAPGYFPTELNADSLEDPRIRERLHGFTPLGRYGERGELRSAILFLASPGSTYVTGTTVFVDGGYTAW